MMRQLAQEAIKLVYTSTIREAVPEAAEEALSYAYQIGFESANNELKTASLHFVECDLLEMAQNGAFDEVLDRTIGHWTQASTFMGAFARHALNSSQFARPVATSFPKT